jgi:hypothetical protein
MFADPQTLTINSVPYTLARVSTNGLKSIYQTADGNHVLTLSHSVTKDRIRSMARLDTRQVVADPLTSASEWANLAEYHVWDRPLVGFSSTEVTQQTTGFKTWLDSTAIGKIFGQES